MKIIKQSLFTALVALFALSFGRSHAAEGQITYQTPVSVSELEKMLESPAPGQKFAGYIIQSILRVVQDLNEQANQLELKASTGTRSVVQLRRDIQNELNKITAIEAEKGIKPLREALQKARELQERTASLAFAQALNEFLAANKYLGFVIKDVEDEVQALIKAKVALTKKLEDNENMQILMDIINKEIKPKLEAVKGVLAFAKTNRLQKEMALKTRLPQIAPLVEEYQNKIKAFEDRIAAGVIDSSKYNQIVELNAIAQRLKLILEIAQDPNIDLTVDMITGLAQES